jgi:hypothetical protein
MREKFHVLTAWTKITTYWINYILFTSIILRPFFFSCAEARVFLNSNTHGEIPSIITRRRLLLGMSLRLKGGEKSHRNVSSAECMSASNHRPGASTLSTMTQRTEHRSYQPLKEIWTLSFIMAFINIFASSTLMLQSDISTNALNYQVAQTTRLSAHTSAYTCKHGS